MVVDIVCLQHQAGEFLQKIVFFVAGPIGTDYTAGRRTSRSSLFKPGCNQLKGLIPCRRNELAVALDQRTGDAPFMVGKVECIPPLDAQEIAVDAALVAIVAAHNLHSRIAAANAERRLAAVSTMRANGSDVLHLPGTGLVAVSPRGQRADRADVDAHAAFFAFQMVFFIGSDDGAGAAILDAQSPDVHAFAAY